MPNQESEKRSIALVQKAIAEIREGKMVILTDDEDRENEGDLVMAAEKVTPQAINFMAREGRGEVLSVTIKGRWSRRTCSSVMDRHTRPRPSADSEFTLRRSRFLANTRYGLLLTGYAGDPARFREVTDSLFRWNGIGVHATCVNLVLERCRLQDNLGNGIFASNFLAEPTTTVPLSINSSSKCRFLAPSCFRIRMVFFIDGSEV